MNVFGRVEAACARAVERTFAVAFPSALEPVQIARKLVARFEATTGRHGLRFVVQLSSQDAARLADERSFLERQWRTMLARLAQHENRDQPIEVSMREIAGVATGTVQIAIEPYETARRLALRVVRGVPQNARLLLTGNAVIGRDPSCEFALVDVRVSRRHCAIDLHDDAYVLRDLHSSNGTLLNGRLVERAAVVAGDVIRVGDSELALEVERP